MEKKNIVTAIMKGDNWLWGIYIVLLCVSLVEMFSASSRLAYMPGAVTNDSPAVSHARHLFVGLAIALLCQSSTKMLFRYWWDYAIFAIGILLLYAMPVLGTSIKGDSVRSIFGVQPVEICKVGLMLFLCKLITAKDALYHVIPWMRVHTQGRRFLVLLLIIAITAIPILFQNLSSAIIICLASLGVMFLGDVRLKYIWQLCLAAAIGCIFGLIALKGLHVNDEYRRDQHAELVNLGPLNRAHTWASRIFGHDDETVPLWEQNFDGENSQVIYAHMALANGIPLLQGPGNSKLRDFLPEAYSDYIFAIIVEELGFVGIGVLLLYLVLLARCFILSRHTEDPYLRLMMISLPLVMVIQALLHIGVCTDAMFVTGQPLPLISHGGSGILMTSVSFGLMFALSRLIDAEVKEREQSALADSTTEESEQLATAEVSEEESEPASSSSLYIDKTQI